MEKLYHIGRDKIKNEIFIDDDYVSLSHAQIYIDKNIDLTIIDISPKNGVIVNNNKIKSPQKLEDQDLITLGIISFKKKDILSAIKLYENNKIKKNISFSSTINQDVPKTNNSKKNNSKKLIYFLIIALAIAITLITGYFLNKQNEIRDKILKDRPERLENSDLTNETNETNETKINKPLIKVNKKNPIALNSSKTNKQRTDILFDFSCLSSEGDQGTNELILEFGELTREVQNTLLDDIEISIKEEKKQGNDYVEFLKKENKFISTGADYSRLKRIMNDLIPRLAEPRGVNYEMFFIDDKVKNVFTIGGNIIFHKGMYDFCKSDSEIASLISHEIAHNELGHSILALKKQKLSSDFGILGELALMFDDISSTSFNQKQEAQADMFGFDLMYPLNYDDCASIDLLKRISKNEAQFNIVDNLFKSHPYSKNRISCLENHFKSNYKKTCN